MRHLWNGLWKTKEHGVPRHRTQGHVAEDTGRRCTPICEGLQNTESHDTGHEDTSQWTQGGDAHLVTATAVKAGSEDCRLRLGTVQQHEHLSVFPSIQNRWRTTMLNANPRGSDAFLCLLHHLHLNAHNHKDIHTHTHRHVKKKQNESLKYKIHIWVLKTWWKSSLCGLTASSFPQTDSGGGGG